MPDRLSPEKLQVFLCHSSGDALLVRALYHRLKGRSWIQPWLDEADLLPGQSWRDEIEKVIQKSHVILVCLSPSSLSKEGYIQREIKIALDYADNLLEDRVYIIPIKLHDCEIPHRLKEWQSVNHYEERGFSRILTALQLRAVQVGILTEMPNTTATEPMPASAPPSVSPTPKPVASTPTVTPPSPPETEQVRLLRETANPATTHTRRAEIGNRLSALGDIRRGVGLREDGLPNIDWRPVTPGGKLVIENQTFEVPPFYISRYLITYAQYEAFVRAADGYNNPEWWKGFPREYRPQKLDAQNNKAWSNPRDTISWYQAVAFTRWLNTQLRGWQFPDPEGANKAALIIGQSGEIRLPTEWEWQWVAQGGNEQRKYPWGEWEEGYANTKEARLKATTAVGMYPLGKAACGAMDMSGNVWEWCLNTYTGQMHAESSGAARVLRGGSFSYGKGNASCMYRSSSSPNSDDDNDGFRVVVGLI